MPISAAELNELKKSFLPPHIPMGGFVRPLPPQMYKEPPVTAATKQRDRALGQYGYNLLDVILKDYSTNLDRVWKPAIENVTAALGLAVENRDRTLKLAQAEREQQAAFNAFMFSLLTAGAMRFVGAYVQYAFVPSFKANIVYGWSDNGGLSIVPQKVIVSSTEVFSKLQQSAFGGIAQDLGNRFANLALPKPKQAQYDLTTLAGVLALQADMKGHIDECAKKVIEQFTAIQTWMNEDTEFGWAWSRLTDGNIDNARVMIRTRIKEF